MKSARGDLDIIEAILTAWREATPDARQEALAMLRAAVKQEGRR